MTDAAMSYQETVAERSVLKKSAAHRKNGSATTKLGNKRLSWKEIAEKHGPCKTYSVEGLLNYEQFKDLPDDLKVEWINRICDKYDISIKHISRYLFEMDDKTLSDYLGDCKILFQCSPGKKRAKSGLNQFREDIVDWKRRENIAEIIDISEMQNQMQEFMTYEQYFAFPLDEKVSYLNSLVEKYNVSLDTISMDLFERAHSTLKNYFYGVNRKHPEKKILEKFRKLDRVKPEMQVERNVAFKNAVSLWKNTMNKTEEVENMIHIISEDPVVEVAPVEVTPLPYIEEKPLVESAAVSDLEYHDMHFSVSYIGKGLNIAELQAIATMLGNSRVKVNIDISTV